MATTRLGIVSYLNTLPLTDGLERAEGLELVPAAPANIVGLLTAPSGASSRVDVGLVSVIDGLRSPEPLVMVPSGMIGCRGRTLTVRVFSRVPMDRVRRVHADQESHTSIALMQVVFAHRFGGPPELVDFDARERLGTGNAEQEWPETVLLIGDKVVTESPPAVRYPHQLDLGEAWHELTGLPFVYAMWMARAADLDDPSSRARLATISAMLDRQRRHNQTRLDWVVSRAARERRWPADLAREYVGDLLSYEVDGAAREGLARFLDEARSLGLASGADPVYFDAAPVAAATGEG